MTSDMAKNILGQIRGPISRVLLAWISRYLDNLDSAISSLNLARFLKKKLCMIYIVYLGDDEQERDDNARAPH